MVACDVLSNRNIFLHRHPDSLGKHLAFAGVQSAISVAMAKDIQQCEPDNAAKVRTQAYNLLESLRTIHTQRALDPYWGRRFWVAVRDAETSGLDPSVLELLRASGYSGPQVLSPPLFEELEQELLDLAQSLEQGAGTLAYSPSPDGDYHCPDRSSNAVDVSRIEMPWDPTRPISMDEVKERAAAGDDVASKALLNIQRLAPEKQHAASWAMLHRIALQQGRNDYVDPATGFTVFTSAFLKQRKCCGFTCRHCPHLKKLAADW